MDDLVEQLNKDIEGEHRAIVQYLYHAWQTFDEALRGQLEGLARDEMRHLEWLSEQVVEMGGTPDLHRGDVVRQGTIPELLASDLRDEKSAITAYDERMRTAEKQGRTALALLLERILKDEERHRDFLSGRLAALEAAGSAGPQENAGESADKALGEGSETLQWGIEHEYEVIMDYVLHAFSGKNAESRHELLDLAVDEMKHLGWLAEHLAEHGGSPDLEHSSTPEVSALKEMLERSLNTEDAVAGRYDDGARRASDEQTKKLLERIRLDEVYHGHVFREMLAKLRDMRKKQFTVGSLKKEV